MLPHNKPIVVLGTGRSGTSAIAGILHHLGVHMGEVFIAADVTNPYGHFEDIDFVQMHRNVTAQNMGPMQATQLLKPLWDKKISVAQQGNIRWGFKDPMTTNLAYFYLNNGFDMDIIWAYRDFSEVEKSSFKAYQWTPDVTKNNLDIRLKIMEDLAKQRKIALKIDFNTLLQQPAQIIAEIIHIFDLHPTEDQIKAAIQHVRKPQAN